MEPEYNVGMIKQAVVYCTLTISMSYYCASRESQVLWLYEYFFLTILLKSSYFG